MGGTFSILYVNVVCRYCMSMLYVRHTISILYVQNYLNFWLFFISLYHKHKYLGLLNIHEQNKYDFNCFLEKKN